MMYLIFSLAALFLTACGDTDNPVVSTAPASKVLQVQPPGTNQPSSRKLVGNNEQTRNLAKGFEKDIRQHFTTGPSHDWKLTAVKLQMEQYTDKQVTFTVGIWTTGSDGRLIRRLGTLRHPSSLAHQALNTFTGNIDLAANTTYALVVDVVGRADGEESEIHMNVTNSGAEDGGSAAGWSIANTRYQRDNDQTAWELPESGSYKIEIHGYAKSSVTVGVPATQNRAARSETVELPLRSTLTGEVLDEYVPAYYGSMLAECQRLRSASSPHDYSQWDEWTDGDGRKIRVRTQAANGWDWVYVYSNGRVTGSRPQTVDECAQAKLSERKVWCDHYGHIEGNEDYCAGL